MLFRRRRHAAIRRRLEDGHYRVRIQRQWWDVPEQAVIKEPNRAGRTMVWPVYD
jgi:hypothetical protein